MDQTSPDQLGQQEAEEAAGQPDALQRSRERANLNSLHFGAALQRLYEER